jgi:hypothetical protein
MSDFHFRYLDDYFDRDSFSCRDVLLRAIKKIFTHWLVGREDVVVEVF